MNPINKKTCIDQLYLLTFRCQSVEVYARSDAEAMQRAIQHFRPKKRERDLISLVGTLESTA